MKISKEISTNVQKYNSIKIQRNTKNEIQHMYKIQEYRGQIQKCEENIDFEILKFHKDLNPKIQPSNT